MSHAIYEGHWKLVMDIRDEPAALYDLKNDRAESTNLIAEISQVDRVARLCRAYFQIRQSK